MNANALKSPECPADAVSGPVTRSDGVRPVAANLDGKTRASLRTRCASDGDQMRYWCPAWAVMAPGMSDSERARIALEHVEEL